MADRYGFTFTGVADGTQPPAMADGGKVGAKRRVIRESFDLSAGYASGDRLYLGRLPTGAYFDGGRIVTSVTLATSTVAIGSATAPAKYRAAAVFQTPDTPTAFGPAAAFAQAALTGPEEVWLTIGTAALPGAGLLIVELGYLVVA